ncbi:Protein M05D6.8 b [Aphelenchoides avenae]|nr:Protein M05D6.8 b [Aphelenchus avenae]
MSCCKHPSAEYSFDTDHTDNANHSDNAYYSDHSNYPNHSDDSKQGYRKIMTEQCPATCGFCQCRDLSARCPRWVANGFCTNPFYKPETRKANCPKSCGLC